MPIKQGSNLLEIKYNSAKDIIKIFKDIKILKAIKNKILETFDVSCCIETMRRAIVGMKITRKLYATKFLTNSPENDNKIIFRHKCILCECLFLPQYVSHL